MADLWLNNARFFFGLNLVRQVKLAYIQTQAKAPPQVRRKQLKHGTGNGIVVPLPPRIKGLSSVASTSRAPCVSPRKPSMI